MIIRLTLFLVCFWASLSMAQERVRLLNTGEPIKVQVNVNQEVSIVFDKIISSVGVPQELRDKVSVESIDYRLWMSAKEAFLPTRLVIKDDDGQLIVLLLSATQTPTASTHYQVISKQEIASEPHEEQDKPSRPYLSFVDLTRFAAQSLYAPTRLIKRINVSRVPVSTENVQLFVCSTRVLCNGNVSAKPIVSWRSAQYYITAVELINQTNRLLLLDPRDLIGSWLSATFQFNRLGSKGSISDTSVIYLVSQSAFEQSL